MRKVLMQKDEPFKGFSNNVFPHRNHLMGGTSSWVTPKTTRPPHLRCRAGTKAPTKASKVARGSGHMGAHLIFACVWGQEGKREDGRADFHSILSLCKHNANRLQQGVSLDLKCYSGSEQYFRWLLLLANSPTTQ